MKSFSSVLSWLLLLAVLAVPSFLFYNWWSKGKKQASLEVAQAPVSANVFTKQASPSAPPAAAPQAPAAVPAAAQAQEKPSAAANAPETGDEETGEEADGEPAPDAASQDGQKPPSAPAAAKPVSASTAAAAAQQDASGSAAVAVSTAPKPVSYYSPASERDPTLTPEDYRRIAAAKRAKEESERQYELMQRQKPKEPGPETLIRLQGIVGNSAIINDDMYTAGQKVKGIKILKIGTDYIICEYKGKRFKKVMR